MTGCYEPFLLCARLFVVVVVVLTDHAHLVDCCGFRAQVSVCSIAKTDMSIFFVVVVVVIVVVVVVVFVRIVCTIVVRKRYSLSAGQQRDQLKKCFATNKRTKKQTNTPRRKHGGDEGYSYVDGAIRFLVL